MGSHLDRIKDWEARARGAKYRVANLARSVKVTPRQLERYFRKRKAFRCHPKDWIRKIRMKEAVRLRRRDLLDKQIAAELFFKRASHFSRVWAQHRRARLKRMRRRRLDK